MAIDPLKLLLLIEKLLFLKYNLRAISFSRKLPDVPEDFLLPNSNVYELEEDEDEVNSDEESGSLYSDTESNEGSDDKQ